MRPIGWMMTALLSVSGCAKPLPPINAISADRIYQVNAEVKRQISVYEARANDARAHPNDDPARRRQRLLGMSAARA
jgi:hypothetical protein